MEAVRKLFHEQMSTKAVQQWTGLQASNAAYTSALLLRMEGKDTVADVVEKWVACIVLPTSGSRNASERRKSSPSAHSAASFLPQPGRTSQRSKRRSMPSAPRLSRLFSTCFLQ